MKKGELGDRLFVTMTKSHALAEKNHSSMQLEEKVKKAEAFVSKPYYRSYKKPQDQKVVHDAFTMLSGDVELIKEIKKRCVSFDIDANKSLVVRAALRALSQLSKEEIKTIISNLPSVKKGRPSYN